jgi:hypothetical protein
VSGFSNVLKAVLKAVLEAKTVTNNLPILSVLQVVVLEFVMVTMLKGYHDMINHDRYFMR